MFKASIKSMNFLAVALVLMGLLVKTQAADLMEAVCKPRPVTVAVSTNHNVVPYHIVLHQCSGTCDNTSPRFKPCSPKDTQEIDLQVTDTDNKQKIVKVTNHTSCSCSCTCRSNEILTNPDSCHCHCYKNCDPVVHGPRQSTGNNKDDIKCGKPYLIGMVAVGLFAIIVLIFDASLFAKKKGFIHTIINHTCCGAKGKKKDQDSPDQEMLKPNGQANGKCLHTEV